MSRLLRAVLAGSFLLCMLAGTATAADQQPPPVVTVLDPGATPRAALRYALVPGTVQEAVFSFTTSVTQMAEGETASGRIPKLDMHLTTSVAAVAADGAFTVPVSIDDIDVEEDAVGAEQIADAVEDLIDYQLTLTMTARGEVLSADAPIPDDLDETSTQLLQQFVDQARSLPVPLPEEEVGVGARWKAVAEATINGISLRQTARYELVEVSADRVELEITIAQTAPRQTITDPISGEEVEVIKSKAAGDGKSTLALGTPLPTESEKRLEVRQRLRAEGQVLTTRITINGFLDPA